MYGASELAQAFCRVAAVHGAVYALRQNVAELLLDPSAQQCTGVRLSTGQVGSTPSAHICTPATCQHMQPEALRLQLVSSMGCDVSCQTARTVQAP